MSIKSFLDISVIKEKADGVLYKAYKMGFYDFNSATPLDLIVERGCGLNIIFEDLDKDLEGLLGAIDLETRAIWLDNSLNHYETKQFCDEARCNYTIAHEIGHFILHKDLFKQNSLLAFHNELDVKARKIETQADMFAARLLMPSELIYKKWNQDFSSISSYHERIMAMTNFFRVSRESMQYRLGNLGIV